MPLTPTNYAKAIAVTPSDTADFAFTNNGDGTRPTLCDALYVGGAGAVVAVFQDGSTASFTAVAGAVLPLRLRRVNATGTAATLMVALYNL
jgi:hypothetical protein